MRPIIKLCHYLVLAIAISELQGATVPPSTLPAAGPARDWKAHPAVVEFQTTNTIYSLGDVHGDYEKLLKLLVGAKLITAAPATPGEVQWAAGTNTLVCTGDMIDKWNQGLEVLRLMRALEASAEKSGGHVFICCGNHEAEFLAAGGTSKKAVEFDTELLAKGLNPEAIANGTDAEGLGAWLRNRPVAVKVNDWFFCHAGNTFGMTVKEIEDAVEKGVNKDGWGTYVLAQPNSILEARMSPVPWWITVDNPASQPASATGPATKPAITSTQTTPPLSGLARLQSYVAALGCKHLVVGHQPGNVHLGPNLDRKAGEPFTYDGILFLTDTGMSRGAADGRPIVLKILTAPQESVSVVDSSGGSVMLWPAK